MNILYIAYSCNPFAGSEDKIGWCVPFESSKTNKVYVITKEEQRHIEVVNRRFKPFIQIIFRQNICLRHALEEMAQYNQYTGNDFYIINPFFSCSSRCFFTHYFVSICCAISASTISSPVLCFSCSLDASLRPLLITQFISQVLHLSKSSLVTLPSR